MVMSPAKTVSEYLASLPEDRRNIVRAARALVKRHLPKGYKESMGFGMITWTIPLSTYPNTYNKQPLCYVGLAAHKHTTTLYLTSPYTDKKDYAALQSAFKKAGKRFDMGKSCLHFKTMDDLVPDAVGKAIASTTPAAYIKRYEQSRRGRD